MKNITLCLLFIISTLYAQEDNSLYQKIYKKGDIEIKVYEVQKQDPTFSNLTLLSFEIEINDNNTLIKKSGELSKPGIVESGIRDLDNDGDIEIFIFFTSEGSGSYGNLIYYELSHSELILHKLPELNSNIRFFYQGHDIIDVKEKTIIQKYPAYNQNDANCCPTGGEITVEFSLNSTGLYETGYSIKKPDIQQSEKESKINLNIKRARNLPDMDAFSACDSWLEISLNNKVIGKTEFQKNNNSPMYNISFELNEEILNPLIIKVFDKDITKNQLVGTVTLNKYKSGAYPILLNLSDGSTKKNGELILEFNTK